MENKITELSNASEKLSLALISIWNEPILRLRCESILENRTVESNNKKEFYNSNCKEPWQVILWCYCSLNTKGSSKASKDWIKRDKFKEMTELFQTFIFSNSNYNDSQKFVAINIILRNFAGGKFLTINKGLIADIYLKKTEELTTSLLHDKIMSVNSFNLSDYENKSTKADSWNLFQLFRECNFDVNEIKKKFQKLSIIDSTEKNLGELKGLSKKYSRNIKMDMRTSDSENFIAIDLRINKILNRIGLNFNIEKKYNEIEIFFIKNVIEDKLSEVILPSYSSRPTNLKGITPWELDRLIYNLGEENLLELYIPN
jgi:hypothetical protein